jgi:hypothetical protein
VRRRVFVPASTIVLAGALLMSGSCAQARPGRPLRVQPVSSLPRSRSSHVVVTVMENEEDTDVLGNPAPIRAAAG